MHEWLSGGASPCQGEGRGFESRLVLFYFCLKVEKGKGKGKKKAVISEETEMAAFLLCKFVKLSQSYI